MIAIEQLIVAPTSDQILDKMLGMLETAGIPARSWRTPSVARSILVVLAELGAQGAEVIADAVAGNFLSFASGDYLTAHALNVFGVARISATYATGTVTLTNAGGAVYTANANEVVVRSGSTGPRFYVSQAFTLAANSTLSVQVTAVDAGSASTVSPAAIDTLETPLSKVTVSNPSAIVGTDAESDDALKARCIVQRGTWSALGPRDAYIAAVLGATLTGGTPTSISRVSVSPSSSTGIVTVVCATPTGTPSTDEITAARAAIEAQARPDSVTVTLSGATSKLVAKSFRVWARGGVASVIMSRAQSALATYLSTYPIGGISKDGGQGYLYDDKLAAIIIGSSPEVFDTDITAGAGDLTLATTEVATNAIALEVRIQ